jgi:hypothetical protein
MKTTAKLSEDGSYYTLSGSKVRIISCSVELGLTNERRCGSPTLELLRSSS